MRRKGTTYQSPRQVRLQMARLIEDYRQGDSEYELEDFRALLWGMSQILSALRLEKDISIEHDLAELRRRVDNLGQVDTHGRPR